MLSSLRAFISKTNLTGLAIAVATGAALKTVVDEFAGDGDGHGIVGGLIAAMIGGVEGDLNDAGVSVNGSQIPVGAFVVSLINFAVMILAVFAVAMMLRVHKPGRPPEGDAPTSEQLLAEILAELRRVDDDR